MKLKVRTEKIVDLQDWDELVESTYRRPYRLQQQDGCRPRGMIVHLSVPSDSIDFPNDTVPEIVNGPDEGVSFKAWVSRDPKKSLSQENRQDDLCTDLWWYRNFYPTLESVANDLHSKGLLDAGRYSIEIDW